MSEDAQSECTVAKYITGAVHPITSMTAPGAPAQNQTGI